MQVVALRLVFSSQTVIFLAKSSWFCSFLNASYTVNSWSVCTVAAPLTQTAPVLLNCATILLAHHLLCIFKLRESHSQSKISVIPLIFFERDVIKKQAGAVPLTIIIIMIIIIHSILSTFLVTQGHLTYADTHTHTHKIMKSLEENTNIIHVFSH